jgi:MFS family permease
VLFGLGLASLIPPLTATAMNSAPDSLAGLASGINNAVARVAGLLWITALPPLTGLTGAAYTHPARFQSSFTQISWICAAAFASAAVLAATLITGPHRPGPHSPKPQCPTWPARSPSAAHRDKPADRTAARQAPVPLPPILWVPETQPVRDVADPRSVRRKRVVGEVVNEYHHAA